ncbi:MAG TPA: FGGY-family carbohydrate kinase [Gallionella sp.]|nr:FGGY-family carbohydrate kinase [Gallionella sp.]
MFLGLDFGTSGARACAIDDDKLIVHEQRVAYVNPGQQTPQDWRTALLELLNGLPQDIAARLRGIAIDGTSGTVLLCDEGLAPVSDALLYNDDRARQQAEQLAAIAPAGHTVLNPTSGLAKFLWLTRRAEQAHYFMHQADWLTALLSGRPGISDYHNALKSGYDVERLRWPDWVLALPHAHLLPDVVAPGADIGPIRADLAARFGIAPSCRIHAGTTDSTAAFIASGVNQPGIGVTSLGTTLVLKQLSDRRIEAPEYGVYSHRYGELWLVGGASNAGAGILKDYFDEQRLAELSALIDVLQDSPLDYYPLSKPGERFPVNDPRLAPRVARPDAIDDAAFLHGLLQGLSRIEVAGYARLAELGAPALRSVLSCGGGAKNEIWMKLRERLLGVPVGTANHAEAAYGCALLCMNLFSPLRSLSSN